MMPIWDAHQDISYQMSGDQRIPVFWFWYFERFFHYIWSIAASSTALKIEILNPTSTLSMLSIAINTIRRRAAAPLASNAATRPRTSPSIFFVQNSSDPLRCVNSHHCMSTTNAYACDSPDGIHDLQDLVRYLCILTDDSLTSTSLQWIRKDIWLWCA